MVDQKLLTRLQYVVWIAIYGGLLTVVLGTFVQSADSVTACWMYVCGVVLVVFGSVLIYVRSRLNSAP